MGVPGLVLLVSCQSDSSAFAHQVASLSLLRCQAVQQVLSGRHHDVLHHARPSVSGSLHYGHVFSIRSNCDESHFVVLVSAVTESISHFCTVCRFLHQKRLGFLRPANYLPAVSGHAEPTASGEIRLSESHMLYRHSINPEPSGSSRCWAVDCCNPGLRSTSSR